jgi:hypothetical protein
MQLTFQFYIKLTLIKDTLSANQVQALLVMCSDKSNAACFAELSIWPALARIANLPLHLGNRNSD